MKQLTIMFGLGVGALGGCIGDPEPAPRTNKHELPVIHGEPSQPGEYPAVGALWMGGDVGCTGTLIRADVVLTAAHCVDPDLVGSEIPGFTLDNDPNVGPSPVIHPGCRTVKHEQFSIDVKPKGLGQFYDVGLVFLSSPVPSAQTMEMATPAEAAALAAGLDVQLVGYGVTSEDTFAYGVKFDAVTDLISFNASELQISAPGTAQNCYGDSGGPGIANLGGGDRIIGIVSRSATNNGNCAEGGIDTRADFYRQWVLDQIAAHDAAGICEPTPVLDAGPEPLVDAAEPPDVDAEVVDEPDAGDPAVEGEDTGCCSVGGGGDGAPGGALLLGAMVGVALVRRRRATIAA